MAWAHQEDRLYEVVIGRPGCSGSPAAGVRWAQCRRDRGAGFVAAPADPSPNRCWQVDAPVGLAAFGQRLGAVVIWTSGRAPPTSAAATWTGHAYPSGKSGAAWQT
jgi:hypothetical protein